MKRLLVDATQCAGCRVCEITCSYTHEGRFSPSLSRVQVIKEDRYGMDYPLYCRQCEHCPPFNACPTGAFSKGETDAKVIDYETCNNCGVCARVCTYKAVSLDPSSRPLVCNLCGGEPECVKECPTDALSYEESGLVTDHPEMIFANLRRRWGIDA